MKEDELREMVHELRAALPALAQTAEERAELEHVVVHALGSTGPDAVGALRAALEHSPSTRGWVRQHAGRSDGVRGILVEGLPGLGTGVTGELFVCPHDDFDFVRESVGQAVPRCPTHDVALIHENA